MKKLILSFSVFLVTIIMSGCSKTPNVAEKSVVIDKPIVLKKPQIIGTVDVLGDITKGIPYNTYESTNFHVVGVYTENNETLVKIDNLLAQVKKHYGNKQDAKKIKSAYRDKYQTTSERNFFGGIKSSKTAFDYAYDYCIRRVELGYFGYFRNVNEKHDLTVTCAERELNKNEKVKIYTGSSSYAEIIPSSKFRNILKLNIQRGKGTVIEKENYTIIVKRSNGKIYLYATFPKIIVNHGSFRYAVEYIKKLLNKDKLKSVVKKTEITADFF